MRTKIIVAIMTMLLSVVCFGCGQDPVQEDLLNYINTELSTLADLETEALQKYESVTGDNYTDDFVLYETLSNEIIPTYRKFVEGLEEIKPKTKEVQELHGLYVEAANTQYNAFVQIMAAIEQLDTNIIANANEKLSEGRKKLREFETKLLELAEEHNVTLEQ